MVRKEKKSKDRRILKTRRSFSIQFKLAIINHCENVAKKIILDKIVMIGCSISGNYLPRFLSLIVYNLNTNNIPIKRILMRNCEIVSKVPC